MKRIFDEQTLRREVEAGLISTEIAKKYGCDRTTVMNSCRRFGIIPNSWVPGPRLGRRVFSEADFRKAVSSGKTTGELATLFSCNKSTVQRAYKRFGIAANITPPSRKRTKTFDTRYFRRLSSHNSAYFVGFIAADGGRDRNWGVKISIHPRDVEVLDAMCSELHCSFGPDTVEAGSRVKLGLYDVDLVADLEQYGIVERKTATLPFAKNVPDRLVYSYLRGFIDGDGFVTKRNAGFVTGSEAFYRGFMSWYLDEWGFEPWSSQEGKKFRVVFNKLKDRKFINRLYADDGFRLSRKFEKFQEYWSDDDIV